MQSTKISTAWDRDDIYCKNVSDPNSMVFAVSCCVHILHWTTKKLLRLVPGSVLWSGLQEDQLPDMSKAMQGQHLEGSVAFAPVAGEVCPGQG